MGMAPAASGAQTAGNEPKTTMNARRCHKIAERISAGLVRELGQGIDAQRLVADTLYARDVLFVCDAYPGSELASLAQHFRAALAESPAEAEATAAGRESSGFSASRFLNSLFGPHAPAEGSPSAARQGIRGWFGGARHGDK